MLGVLLWLYVLALTVWLGETVFFSLVIAPRLFSTLPVEQAGTVVGLLFPVYYAVGGVCAALLAGLALLLQRAARPGGRAWMAAALVAGVGFAAILYAGLVVQPRASVLRLERHRPDAPASAQAEFDALHRRAMQLNVVALLTGLTLSGLLAAQLSGAVRAARRPGIGLS